MLSLLKLKLLLQNNMANIYELKASYQCHYQKEQAVHTFQDEKIPGSLLNLPYVTISPDFGGFSTFICSISSLNYSLVKFFTDLIS